MTVLLQAIRGLDLDRYLSRQPRQGCMAITLSVENKCIRQTWRKSCYTIWTCCQLLGFRALWLARHDDAPCMNKQIVGPPTLVNLVTSPARSKLDVWQATRALP